MLLAVTTFSEPTRISPPDNLLENGSFEDNNQFFGSWGVFKPGELTGWTIVAPEGVMAEVQRVGLAKWKGTHGSQWLELDGDETGPGVSWNQTAKGRAERGLYAIEQHVEVTANIPYELRFDYAGRPGRKTGDNQMGYTVVDASGQTIFSGTIIAENTSSSTPVWKTATTVFTPTTSGSLLVRFQGEGTDNTFGMLLDNTVLVKVPIVINIDTDSNNDGHVDAKDDPLEEDSPGKRIFINTDDDNKNGIVDTTDTRQAYLDKNLIDKDFAEIRLAFDAGAAKLSGFKLWLSAAEGLVVWGDRQKLPLSSLDQKPDEAKERDDGLWHVWTLGLSGVGNFPASLYVEGTEVGDHRVVWQLRNAGDTVVAEDTVIVTVEEVVWPFKTQEHADWNERATSDWTGLSMAAAWWTEKALIDYILHPDEKGTVATIHPDMAGQRASADGADSRSTETYGADVTIAFDYTFDRRGGNEFGYVQANLPLPHEVANNDDRRKNPGSDEDTDRVKLSFVSNSGIKFGGDKEVAILDTERMIALAGGLDAFELDADAPRGPKGIDDAGKVDIMRTVFGALHDFEDEPLNQLMSGILYKGGYAAISDFQPADQKAPVSLDFIGALSRNAARQKASNRMEIIFSGTALTVKINGEQVYHDAAAGLTLGQFDLQAHWGSGVVFSKMDVTVH